MLRFISKYLFNICFALLGFYVSAFCFSIEKDSDSYISSMNSLGTFLASAGGLSALLTLIYIIHSKDNEKEEQEVQYFKYMLFVLYRQIDLLGRYWEEMKDYKDAEDRIRAARFEAVKFDSSLVDILNLEKCIFLLSSENVNLLPELDRSQRWLKSISIVIGNRNDIYLNEFQANLLSKYRAGQDVSIDLISAEHRDFNVLAQLTEMTNVLYRELPELKKLLEEVRGAVNSELIRRYPHRKYFN